MPPRRSHKKSRAGCRRCKSRKIKCDEAHPRCGNCLKHGVACDFEHPELADSFVVPETPGSMNATSPAFCDSTATVPASPSPETAKARPSIQLYQQPSHSPISTTTKNNRMMELRLLHHYTTATFKTLTISDSISGAIFRDTVPCIAFDGANYLADALLAVAALHLRSSSPQDQGLIRASHAYSASSLAEYSSSLSKGINSSNAEALFLTSILIAFQSAASRIFARDDGAETKDRGAGYTLPLSWFHSFQGIKAIVATSWQWLRSSGIVVPIISAQPALDLNMSSQETTFFGHLLNGLEEELQATEQDPGERLRTRQAYQHAIAVLNWSHKIPLTGAPIVFLATVSRRYIELLQARRPRALAILACFFALLKSLDGVWWLKGIARREVLGIITLFDPDDQQWWPRLQWPVRIAMYDGDVIPPDIWGADLKEVSPVVQQPGHGGSYISHIELLSQMACALQSIPNLSAASAVENTYQNAEGQIAAQELFSQSGDVMASGFPPVAPHDTFGPPLD